MIIEVMMVDEDGSIHEESRAIQDQSQLEPTNR
jgi:hypothetical protein